MNAACPAAELVERLERLACEAGLLAAHHGELMAAGRPLDGDVRQALRAATYFGFANGLRLAAQLIVGGDGQEEGGEADG